MSELNIDQLIRLQRFILDFRSIERAIYIPGTEKEHENDVEHSYMLALTCWMLAEQSAPHLNNEKLLKYALVHDLVEVYAGDTHAMATEQERQKKLVREAKALKDIAHNFKDLPWLVETIGRYEAQDDEESQFVYAIDKVLPMVINYLDGGRAWHDWEISIEQVLANKETSTKKHPLAYDLMQQLSAVLKEHPEMFYQPDAD